MSELITNLYYYHGVLFWKNTIHNRAKKDTPAGTIKQNGYIEIQYKKLRYYAHRIIYTMFYGNIPENMVIDHIDKDVSNNRIENLRCVTQSYNLLNINKRVTNKSGFLGVSWDKRREKWVSSFSYKGKRLYREWYTTKKEAIETLFQIRHDFLQSILY